MFLTSALRNRVSKQNGSNFCYRLLRHREMSSRSFKLRNSGEDNTYRILQHAGESFYLMKRGIELIYFQYLGYSRCGWMRLLYVV